jgi:DNA primase
MDRIEIERLRDLPIVGVAQRLGLRVNSRRQCLCPFHADHHPSMSLGRNNKYRCFVCGAHGDVIELVMRHLQKSFPDACRWLMDGSGVTVNGSGVDKPHTSDIRHQTSFDASRYAPFFERPFLNDEARRFLFDERRLDPRVVSWCRLTSWHDRQGVAWLETPYYDHEGRLVGIQNRNLVRGALPRFRFPSGSWCGVYNLPVLNRLRQGEDLYITEGCSDCWAMLSAGHKAIAIPSATLLTKEVRNQLETCNLQLETHFHMYPDRDEPGERLFLQLKELLPSLQHHQLPPGCKDFSEYYLSVR